VRYRLPHRSAATQAGLTQALGRSWQQQNKHRQQSSLLCVCNEYKRFFSQAFHSSRLSFSDAPARQAARALRLLRV